MFLKKMPQKKLPLKPSEKLKKRPNKRLKPRKKPRKKPSKRLKPRLKRRLKKKLNKKQRPRKRLKLNKNRIQIQMAQYGTRSNGEILCGIYPRPIIKHLGFTKR